MRSRTGLAPGQSDLWPFLRDELPHLQGNERYWALAQFDQQVAWGVVTSQRIEWDPAGDAAGYDPALLLDLRVFAADRELHLWQTPTGSYDSRTRVDGTGQISRVLDEVQYLWGTSLRPESGPDGWVELVEGRRGIGLRLPWSGLRTGDLPLKLAVRSYLGTDERGLVDVVDVRLCGLFTRTVPWPVEASAIVRPD